MPEQVAASWRDREGLVFLDSSLLGNAGQSFLAAEPQQVYTGSLESESRLLQDILKQHAGEPGGLFGWIGFEGNFTFGHYPQVHVFDHRRHEWRGDRPVMLPRAESSVRAAGSVNFQPLMSREDFCRRVHAALEYIAAGDIYQVNLSYPWEAEWDGSIHPWEYYQRLRAVSPVPHGAYFNLAGMQICCASPECFLTLQGRRIVTRPIKGTRPRGVNAEADLSHARELLASAKERAELVMITDLLRNDIGKVCEFGSVRVSALCELELFAQVQHLVSTIEGTLRAEVDHVEALKKCFPGGSISGAPKKRALEIIAELEPHARGLYTGALGYFGFDGSSQFNIVIRTGWVQDGKMRFYTGAGIVADSQPELEWEETRHKAAGLLKAASQV